MGHRYFARGEFEKAAECYAKALETDGPHSHVAVMHALCTRRLGRLKSADNGFKKLAGEGESRAGWTRWVEEIERIITSVKGAEDER
jgi:Tfp pilus assembly protein PilF